MTGTLRPIKAIAAPDVTRAVVGEMPELVWLPLESLVINDEYQRSLSERSITTIRTIVRKFDWARLKALSCVAIGDGKYEVIDGQHTAIAAATHGGIATLPCMVTGEKTLAERAGDFVGLNRDRVSMTPVQVFFAEVAAEDENSVDVVQGVTQGGGRILKSPPPYGQFKIGDVQCIAALKAAAKQGGPAWVKRIVSVAVEARCAPIKATIAKAIMELIWTGEEAGKITDQQIVDVLRVHGQESVIEKARILRKDILKPMPHCTAAVIRRLA